MVHKWIEFRGWSTKFSGSMIDIKTTYIKTIDQIHSEPWSKPPTVSISSGFDDGSLWISNDWSKGIPINRRGLNPGCWLVHFCSGPKFGPRNCDEKSEWLPPTSLGVAEQSPVDRYFTTPPAWLIDQCATLTVIAEQPGKHPGKLSSSPWWYPG